MATTDCFTQYDDSCARSSDSKHHISASVNCSSVQENATCQIQYGSCVIEDATIKMNTTSKIKLYDAISQATGKHIYVHHWLHWWRNDLQV